MNKGELKDLVTSTLHREGDTRFLAQLDGFVTRATQRIGRDLRARENTTIAELTYNGTDGYDLPAGFQEAILCETPGPRGWMPLVPAGGNQQSNAQNVTGTYGRSYWIIDSLLTVAPDTQADVRLSYYASPATLVSDSSTNAVLDAFEQLYLAACMTFATQWAEESTFSLWVADYEAEMTQINEARRQQRQPVSQGPYDYRGGTFAV